VREFLFLAAIGVAAISPAYASLSFDVTYGNSITSLSNAAAIETLITNTLAIYSADFKDPITVALDFEYGGGLGSSSYVEYTNIPYATYRAALAADATSPDDTTAVSNLPNTTNDPVLNNLTMDVKSATGRAVGLSTPAATTAVNDAAHCTGAGTYDGCIGINWGITNIGDGNSSGGFNAQAVLEHEIDEVLGLGSSLEGVSCSGPSCATTTILAFGAQISPEDLFRYTLAGARTFVMAQTCSSISNDAYLSIDGGATQIDQFNQACDGGDFGDWIDHATPEVQDWQGTASGATPIFNTEVTALDVVGYDLSSPEPSTFALVGGILVGAAILRRRLRRA